MWNNELTKFKYFFIRLIEWKNGSIQYIFRKLWKFNSSYIHISYFKIFFFILTKKIFAILQYFILNLSWLLY